MEEEIRGLRKSLGTFCNHLESNCDALKQSLDRRPIPLGTPFLPLLPFQPSTRIHQTNLHSSSIFLSNLNLIQSSFCDRFGVLELHKMPEPARIERQRRSQRARFDDVRDRLFRGAFRQLQRGLQEEPERSCPAPGPPPELWIPHSR
jgi:hypothetical protein